MQFLYVVSPTPVKALSTGFLAGSWGTSLIGGPSIWSPDVGVGESTGVAYGGGASQVTFQPGLSFLSAWSLVLGVECFLFPPAHLRFIGWDP